MTSPTPHPRPIPGFTITRDTLNHMAPLHRLAAAELIRKGKWGLVEDDHTGQAVSL